jgi:hypothetical protein
MEDSKDWKECLDCPEILTEKYGIGEDKCAECIIKDKSMTKYCIFSTANSDGYEKHGREFLKQALENVDKDIDIHFFAEDFEQDIEDERLYWHDIESVDKWKDFKLKHLDKTGAMRKDNGKVVYNYRFNCTGFSAKIFPLQELAKLKKYDFIISLDTDVIFHKELTADILGAHLHPGATAAYLGRKDYPHSETGFVAYNMNRNADRMIDRMVRVYESGKVFELEGWTDSYVFDYVREEYENAKTDYFRFYNISKDIDGLHVWPKTWLAEYMDHLKGPAAKEGVPWLNEFPNTLVGQAIHTVSKFKPRTIVDVGLDDGVRAVGMAKASLWAQSKSPDVNAAVHLWALDPFGDKQEEILNRLEEFAGEDNRFSYTYANLHLNPEQWNPELAVDHPTLDRIELGKSDFAYVDGEHTVEALKRDLHTLLPYCKMVMTPTYLLPDEEGKCQDTNKFGSNQVLADTVHKVLPAEAKCEEGGIVRAAIFGNAISPGSGKVQTRNAVPDEQIQSQIKNSLKHHPKWIEEGIKVAEEKIEELKNRRQIPFVGQCRIHDLSALILAGGPSICDTKHPDYAKNWHKINEVRQREDVRTFVVKTCHDHMIHERKEVPWGCILLDPRAHVKDFIDEPHPEVRYFVASMVHPSTLDVLLEKAPKLYIYNAAVKAGEIEYVAKELNFKHAAFFGGGSSSATRGIGVLHGLGFRKFEVAGWDQEWPSYMNIDWNEKDTHGRPRFIKTEIEGRTFITQPILLAAAQDFEQSYKEHNDLEFTVLTDGMIKVIWDRIKRDTADFKEIYN